jgi:polysaccharide biosynthesis transport protein
MNLTQLIDVLAGRRNTVLGVMLAVALSVIAVSLWLPKRYTASAGVLVDTRGVSPLGATAGGEISHAANLQVMATQADLIGSERVARRVAALLNLQRDPQRHERWLDETKGQGDEASWHAAQLLRRLDVKPGRDSNVLNIAFTGSSAKAAAEGANAFARAGIETSLDLKVEPARQFAGWFDERSKTLRNDLAAAQQRLTEAQRKKDLVVGAPGQIDIETAKMAQLAAQLVQVQAAVSESNSRQVQARADAKASPDVLNNAAVGALRSAISTAQGNLQDLEIRYGELHPQVITAREHAALLRAQLEREMQTVAHSVSTSNAVNEQREREARAALAAQKAKVLALMNGSDEVVVLQRDVESAQRALEAATTRQSQTALESQMQQTNIVLLSEAAEPAFASAPKIVLNGVSGAALGLLLGIALALWREMRAPLIRSADDLAVVLDLPLLTTLPRALLRPDLPAAARQPRALAA